MRVTVWSEGRHERVDADVARRYPAGMHAAVAARALASSRGRAAPFISHGATGWFAA
jgi:trehalose utilization protein